MPPYPAGCGTGAAGSWGAGFTEKWPASLSAPVSTTEVPAMEPPCVDQPRSRAWSASR